MKPSNDSQFTSGEGGVLIEFRSKGAPITDEARERARRRAEALKKEKEKDSSDAETTTHTNPSPAKPE